MNNERKSIIATMIVLLIGCMIGFLITVLLVDAGYILFSALSIITPFFILGIYTIFGKYVYFRGEELTQKKRIIIGMWSIFLPIIIVMILLIWENNMKDFMAVLLF